MSTLIEMVGVPERAVPLWIAARAGYSCASTSVTSPRGVAPPVSDDCAPTARTSPPDARTAATSDSVDGVAMPVDFLLWIMIGGTVWSGIHYAWRGVTMLRAEQG